MDQSILKSALIEALPILDRNLAAASEQYRSGDLAAGAFRYVRSRHQTALAVINASDSSGDTSYRACASITIDLRSGVRQMPDVAVAKAVLERWLECFHKAGFTEMHPYLDVPVLPGQAVRG